MPFAAAMSPICAAVNPETSNREGPAAVMPTSGPTSTSPSRAASGLRTSTDAREAAAIISVIGRSAISLPFPITMRCWAVRAISLIRWLEISTVRPSAARLFSRLRIHRMPSGSSPLTGSSRIRVAGSPSRVAAMPSRWPMPSENAPARLPATSVRPTMSIRSSTRLVGMPWVAASTRRWLYADRPVCTDLASSSAPTSCSGAGMSA